MKSEQQRIAIAEACGWTNVAPLIVKNVKHKGDDITVGISSDAGWIPDYLNDLNAMHEAEKVLFCDKWKWLAYVNNLNEMPSLQDEWLFASIHATAAQRAEAFLRTIGKWEDSK